MFCPKCGNRLPDGSAFCGKCGTRLAAPAGAGGRPTAGPTPSKAAVPNAAPSRPAAPPAAAKAPALAVAAAAPSHRSDSSSKLPMPCSVRKFSVSAARFRFSIVAQCL